MSLLHRAVRPLLRRTGVPVHARGGASAQAHPLRAIRTLGVLLAGTLTLAGAVTSVVASAAPAAAHAVLVRATPADGAVLATAPTSVTLQFDDPISTSFATLAVTGPDGSPASSGKASVSGTTVSAALEANLAPGRYRTVFRVVSEDGHPVNGQLTFTVAPPGSAAPPASASGSAPSTSATVAPGPSSTAGASTGTGSSAAGGSWLADNLLPLTGALLLVVIGAGALLWDRLRH